MNFKKLVYIQSKANVPMIWMYIVGASIINYPLKIYKGKYWDNQFWIGDGNMKYLFDDEVYPHTKASLASFVSKELLKDPKQILAIRKKFEETSKKFLRQIEFLKKEDFSGYTLKNLVNMYMMLMEEYKKIYPYGEPITLFTSAVSEYLEKYVEKKGISPQQYNIMISPKEISFLQREKMSMLNIAITAKKSKGVGKIKKLLDKHTLEFEWIPYDYGAFVYDKVHFTDEFNSLVAKPLKELEEQYENLCNYTKTIEAEQKKITKTHHFDSYHVSLFQLLQHAAFLMDYKKEVFTKFHLYSNNLFEEIGRHFGMTGDDAKHILPQELNILLYESTNKNKNRIKQCLKEIKQKIRERKQCFVLILLKGDKAEIIQGEKALPLIQKMRAQLAEAKMCEGQNEIHGKSAFKGIVRGRVRVIFDSKLCHLLKHGEILVTNMTSPDFMMAVKKAAAVVTDEGGITCHAAIVARELKKPCIIGTKIATKLLKEGDIVEVDADKGVVRRL